MDFLLNGLASFIDKVSTVVPRFEFIEDVGSHIAVLVPYFQKANMFFPIDTLFRVMSLFITLQLILISFYFITRAINLLRGSG